MGLEHADLAALYERHLACGNERRFDELVEFVSEQVSGSASRGCHALTTAAHVTT